MPIQPLLGGMLFSHSQKLVADQEDAEEERNAH